MKIRRLIDTSELWLTFEADDEEGPLLVEISRNRAIEISQDLAADPAGLKLVEKHASEIQMVRENGVRIARIP